MLKFTIFIKKKLKKMTNEISIKNFVEVSIEKTQPSLGDRNINSIGLFTKEVNLTPMGDYVVYKDSGQALKDWGVDSLTYRAVSAIFSQSPNVNTGNGLVYVFRLKNNVAIAATSAYVEFKDLIVENFKKVSDGDLSVKFGDDAPIVANNINFTGVNTLEDIASIFAEAMQEAEIDDVAVSVKNNSLFFTRIEPGLTTESITFGGTLAGVDYLNAPDSWVYHGSDAYQGVERLQDAMARAGEIMFYEVALPVFDETDTNLQAASDYINDKPQMLVIPKNSVNYLEPNGLFDNLRQKFQTKTRCLYYGHIVEKFIFASAYLGNWLTANFSGSNTLRNLHAKTLTGVLPDGTITQTLLEKAQNVGADIYANTGGLGAVFCSGTNEWFDAVYGLNALQIYLEDASFNTLRTGNKIPQTSEGVIIFENSYREVLKVFANSGFIGAGKWTLPYSFGNAEDFETSIEKDGFYIYTDPLSGQLPTNRQRRIKPTAYIAVKLKGAFNKDFIYIVKND
jgi:hypothetical protein